MFKNGRLHGLGREISPSSICEGQFEDGYLNGYGREIYHEGDYYIGFFSHSKKHGYGKIFKADGNIVYQGVFEYDSF